MSQTLGERVCSREKALRSSEGRKNFEILWQQVARLALPRKAFFNEEVSPGVERTRWILDSTAPRSLELFASFLHTLLNNPASRWFTLEARDASGRLIESNAAKSWLEDTEKRMLNRMTRHSANVYSHLHQVYFDLGAFGTAVMYVDTMKNIDDDLRIRQYHLGDCVVAVDEHGLVNEIHRQFKYTAEQARARWPKVNLGKMVEEALKSKDEGTRNNKFRFLHSVVPATSMIGQMVPGQSPFVSVWSNTEDRVAVQKGTFEEFPYQVPRWYINDREVYGRSPAITVLPDIRMVNKIKDTLLRGLEKMVDPPLLLPDGGMVSPIRLSPGSISFSDGSVTPQQLIPSTGTGIQLGQFELSSVQETIRDGFFIPLFATPESPVKTATQVLQEADERNKAVSPMLVRQQTELFDPFIRRAFKVMSRAGVFLEPPSDLAGATIEVNYNSPLVASQKQAESLGAARLIEAYSLYSAATEGDGRRIFDNIDPDNLAKVFHEGSGAPMSVLRDETAIRELREAEDEQQEQAETLSAAIPAAGAVADLAKAGVIPTGGA